MAKPTRTVLAEQLADRAELARLQAERDRAMTACGLLALDLRSCEEERDALRAELDAANAYIRAALTGTEG